MICLDPRRTALLLLDLQQGVLRNSFVPHDGQDVASRAAGLAARARAAGALVCAVRAEWAADFADAPRQPVDQPPAYLKTGLPADWSEPADELAGLADIAIAKRQWGAFHGTELDLQLRRRGIDTLILTGVATNFAVDTTAREAWSHGYAVVVAEDATSSFSLELHRLAIDAILPRIARITTTGEIAFA